ncbi:cupin domain-containing protein [Microbacterium sp. No. 7]|uniref:cupin domain-containing protein n=1 Tax=Microbacterium sp. No. 7 TaxID=1714373 RepID=UPI0006D26297|nr:cupin domain-containing protein [Microbacterium sp. No. 7]
MKVLLNADVPAVVQHGGTVRSYFMYEQQELRDETMGSFLEFVNEFTVAPGAFVEPHFHNSHEFYYVLTGRGVMRVGDEVFPVAPGDLVHTPPNVPHSLFGGYTGVRSLAFAVGFQEPGEDHTAVEFDNWPPELPDADIKERK